jgi:HemY protein
MKRLILAIATATVLAVGIGLTAYYFGPGYVVFSFGEISVETSFIFMLGFLAVAFFIFHYLVRVFSVLLHIPDYLGLRYSSRLSEKARNALVKGLIEMSEGRFAQAEKLLLKQVTHSDTGLLNYLMAARSAQQQGAYDRRDEYLRLAHESTPSADIAIGITQAELQLSHKQYEQSLATLNHLSSIAPKHGYIKKLQARVYEQLNDWESLGRLLEEVKKSKLISEDKLNSLEIETYSGMLTTNIKQQNQERTKQIWQQIPKKLKDHADLLKIYINFLVSLEEYNDAEKILRSYLSNHWQDSMVCLYAQLETTNPQKQLETAESWLQGHARSASLLMVLGKLCISNKLWGKARNYLETSLDIEPLAETYLQLAMLLEERMDEADNAQAFYQKGLNLAVNKEQGQNTIQATDTNLLLTKDTDSTAPVLKIIQ